MRSKLRQSQMDAAAYPIRLLVKRPERVQLIDDDPEMVLVSMFPRGEAVVWQQTSPYTGEVRAIYFKKFSDAAAWLDVVGERVDLVDGTASEVYTSPYTQDEPATARSRSGAPRQAQDTSRRR